MNDIQLSQKTFHAPTGFGPLQALCYVCFDLLKLNLTITHKSCMSQVFNMGLSNTTLAGYGQIWD